MRYERYVGLYPKIAEILVCCLLVAFLLLVMWLGNVMSGPASKPKSKDRTMKRLTKPLALCSMLVGCGHSGPANVKGVGSVLETILLGARGATDTDQRKIDRTIVRVCAGGVWSKEEG
jgi:hypothetical protein